MKNRPSEQNVEEFSPYALLSNFSKNRVIPCVFLAVILHVAVIGGLSYHFIYVTWIDPSSKTTSNEGTGEAPSDEPDSDGAASEDAPSTAGPGTQDGDDTAAAKPSDNTDLEAPVVREITERAAPDEIPKDPDNFGISIDDTNR